MNSKPVYRWNNMQLDAPRFPRYRIFPAGQCDRSNKPISFTTALDCAVFPDAFNAWHMGSMFGTLEDVIISLNDRKLINLRKLVLTAIACG
uniref:DDE_Tnp_1_7 domain-containing protein n=1 Tax=Elaeophora elaphi TaxID=1147741 RepID=A0A0R3RY78_9BILA